MNFEQNYKHIVTVFIVAEPEGGESKDVAFTASLVNFSGLISFGYENSETGILYESIDNWVREISEHVKSESRFEVTLRRESEPGADYYDVVNVSDLDGVLPRG